jgi:hypothetical protein
MQRVIARARGPPRLEPLEHLLGEDDAFLVEELEALADELALLLQLEERAAGRAEAGLGHALLRPRRGHC